MLDSENPGTSLNLTPKTLAARGVLLGRALEDLSQGPQQPLRKKLQIQLGVHRLSPMFKAAVNKPFQALRTSNRLFNASFLKYEQIPKTSEESPITKDGNQNI